MAKRLSDIAAALNAPAFGNVDLLVDKPAEPCGAGVGDLALAMSPRYKSALQTTQAKAAVLWSGANWQDFDLDAAILIERPRLAMAQLTQGFDEPLDLYGVAKSAEISPEADVYADVAVGSFSEICKGVRVGSGTQIGSHVSVGPNVSIGRNCVLHSGVRIGRNVQIGDNVILQPNVVIGADGFSFVTEGPSNEERSFATLGRRPLTPPEDAIRHRIHSLGGVWIGNDVEVGANSTIDAGTIRPTKVGRGTKIDNLVQVGHNVIVGEDCVLCAQTAIAGSSAIGDRTVLGGKSGVKDNVTLGCDVVLGGAAIVLGDVPDGRFMMGYPAVEMPDYRAQTKGVRALPAFLKSLRDR